MLYPIRLINKHIWSSTNRDLPRSFVNSNRLECLGVVNVDRLEELLRTAEDHQCMAGDVGLHGYYISWYLNLEYCEREKTYNNAKTVPQRRAERPELRWGSPRQNRSHRGGGGALKGRRKALQVVYVKLIIV